MRVDCKAREKLNKPERKSKDKESSNRAESFPATMQGSSFYSGGLRNPSLNFGSSGIPNPVLAAGAPGPTFGAPEAVHPDDQANGVVNNQYNVPPYEVLEGHFAEQQHCYVMTFVPLMEDEARKMDIETFRQRNRAMRNEKREGDYQMHRLSMGGVNMFADPMPAFNLRAVNFHLLHLGKMYREKARDLVQPDQVAFCGIVADHFRTQGGVRTATLVQHNQNNPTPSFTGFGTGKKVRKATPIPNFVTIGQSGEVDLFDEWGMNYCCQPDVRWQGEPAYVRLPEKSGLFLVMYMRKAKANEKTHDFTLGLTRSGHALSTVQYQLDTDEIYWTIEPWASNGDLLGEPRFYADDNCIAVYAYYVGMVGWPAKTYDIKRMGKIPNGFKPMRDGHIMETLAPKFNPWLNYTGREWCLLPPHLYRMMLEKSGTPWTWDDIIGPAKEYYNLVSP